MPIFLRSLSPFASHSIVISYGQTIRRTMRRIQFYARDCIESSPVLYGRKENKERVTESLAGIAGTERRSASIEDTHVSFNWNTSDAPNWFTTGRYAGKNARVLYGSICMCVRVGGRLGSVGADPRNGWRDFCSLAKNCERRVAKLIYCPETAEASLARDPQGSR